MGGPLSNMDRQFELTSRTLFGVDAVPTPSLGSLEARSRFLSCTEVAQRTVSAGIIKLIGNTPLLRVKLFERDFPGLDVYAKAEWFNPGGSVKDRAALSMIEDGEKRGALTHSKTIIDSTSGNTGIAYAMVGAAKGYRVKLVMPGNVSAERKALVTAYGAEIVFSDPAEGSDGAIRLVREVVAGE